MVNCREYFNYHLMKLDQSGVRQKLLDKWGIVESWRGEGMGPHQDREEGQHKDHRIFSLGYDNLAFPFVLLCVGVLAAVATVMLEYGKAT